MTDFKKIENYYDNFDEWNRTFTPEGSLEFEITLEIMKKYTEVGDRVLDLGGGPGRYTYELAKSGRIMALGDISPKLISIAKEKTKNIENIDSINVVNAIDLSIYGDNYFDTVLYMGPLYHLTDEKEIDISLKEVRRVLKSGGQIIAGFIPLLSGTVGIIERSMYAPGHVTSENLKDTYRTGTFRNNSEYGFQEGKYLSSEQVVELMSKTGFSKNLVRSTRGLGYKLEKGILTKKEEDSSIYSTIMELIEKTAEEDAIINTCGHALYIGSIN